MAHLGYIYLLHLSHRFINIMLCTHCLLPNPTSPIFPALLLHAIKHLYCVSPIALLSIVSSATAEMEKNRMFQVRACIELYKGIYGFFCYLLTRLNILFTFFCLLLCSWCSVCSNALWSGWVGTQQCNSENHLPVPLSALPLDCLSAALRVSIQCDLCFVPELMTPVPRPFPVLSGHPHTFTCAVRAAHWHCPLPGMRASAVVTSLNGEVCPSWRSPYCTLWTFCLLAIAMTSLSSFMQIFD